MAYQTGHLKGNTSLPGGIVVTDVIRPKREEPVLCCFCRAGQHKKCTPTLRCFGPLRGHPCECPRCSYERREDLID